MQKQLPGIMPTLNLDHLGPQEIEITKNLASIWFVTNVSNQKIGTATYPYLFLKATDELREKFSFFSNVLAILHPYPAIDGRIMDAIEKILVANPNRLDRLCVILISNAVGVDKDVSSLNGSNEARIIIPFKYSELVGGVQGKERIVVNRLEENLFTKDLFSISSALQTDRYFFGRKDDIQYLYGKYQTGENSSIFGLRRIGKTSVLWAILRELKISSAPVAFVDCSDTKFHKSRWNQTLFRIKEALFASNGFSGKGNAQIKYSEEDASACFRQDLIQIKNHFKKSVLIIFDEIESLCFDLSSTNHWKTGPDYLSFWQTLRSIYQQEPGLFTFCICGVNPRAIETAITPDGHDNPLYRYIESRYLGFFQVEDVQIMLEKIGGYMGIRFDPEVFTYLTDDFGGHPFLIRQAASAIYKKYSKPNIPRKILIQKQTYKDHYIEVAKSLHDYVKLILLILQERYNDEYKLLQYLAAGDHETFVNFASDDPAWIQHLIGYGLIVEVNGKFHFRINVIKDTIESEAKHLKSPDNVEERWELLSESRNHLETRLRDIVRSVIKISFGAKIGKEKIISAMVKARQKDKANELNFEQIFNAELYFSDLRRVIENDWDKFTNLFNSEKSKFTEKISLANSGRADAHASQVSKEEFEKIMSAIHWLTHCLDENA